LSDAWKKNQVKLRGEQIAWYKEVKEAVFADEEHYGEKGTI